MNDDTEEGLLDKYKVLYMSGQNFERGAAQKISVWVQDGRVLMARS